MLHSDNMFRRWRVPVKTILKAGTNALRVVFHSPIESMIPKVKALPYQLPSISSHNTGNEEDVATAPYTRKAPYQYGWDWGPRYVTEGIWQPVRLETWDALRIENFHIRQQSIVKEAATVDAELEIDAGRATTAAIEINYSELSGAQAASPIRQTSIRASTESPFRFASRITNCGIPWATGLRTVIVFPPPCARVKASPRKRRSRLG